MRLIGIEWESQRIYIYIYRMNHEKWSDGIYCWLVSRSFCSMLTRKTIANINSRSVSSYSPFKYTDKVWASGPQNLLSRLCIRTVPGSAPYLVVSWVPTWVLVLVWALASPSPCWTKPRARTDVFWNLKQNTRRRRNDPGGSPGDPWDLKADLSGFGTSAVSVSFLSERTVGIYNTGKTSADVLE